MTVGIISAMTGTCSIDGCDKPFYGLGWCEMHYARARRNEGDPGPPAPKAIIGQPLARFWSKVAKGVTLDDCWLWTGSVSGPMDHGRFWTGSRYTGAHRFSYELLVGPIPEGLVIDHLCRVPRCVNPDHLEPVTHRENILRGIGRAAENARKTHCKHGHEYTPENTVWIRDRRICLTCIPSAACWTA